MHYFLEENPVDALLLATMFYDVAGIGERGLGVAAEKAGVKAVGKLVSTG
ncbi:MAG: hypothetical protein ISS63_02980 [Desulfobacteraceae bacterium]|nr:hypothetical protein [Desulfobacteraceae bacterium]